jgi:hypothetical protein
VILQAEEIGNDRNRLDIAAAVLPERTQFQAEGAAGTEVIDETAEAPAPGYESRKKS